MNPGVFWGLATAAAWGTADFAGGIASRRAVPLVVTAGSQAIGLLALLIAVPILWPPLPPAEALAVGAIAGIGGGLGLAFLYEGLARGAMGIVSSLAGAGAVVIPLVVSLVLGTEIAPLAFVGIGLIVLAGLAAAAPPAGTTRPSGRSDTSSCDEGRHEWPREQLLHVRHTCGR